MKKTARNLTVAATALAFFLSVGVFGARLVLSHEVLAQSESKVTRGADGFGEYWTTRKNQIARIVTEASVEDALRKNVQARNATALQSQLSDIARTSNLSFLTVVDVSGDVVARANGSEKGSLNRNSLVDQSLDGNAISTPTLLDASFLADEGLASQASSDVLGTDGTSIAKIYKGLALVTAVPIRDQHQNTIGAIFGGILMNHSYDLVDQAARALGGKTAVLEGNAIVAGTLSQANGTRAVDIEVPSATDVISDGTTFSGTSTVAGKEYVARIEPISDNEHRVIGALWYGTPVTQYADR